MRKVPEVEVEKHTTPIQDSAKSKKTAPSSGINHVRSSSPKTKNPNGSPKVHRIELNLEADEKSPARVSSKACVSSPGRKIITEKNGVIEETEIVYMHLPSDFQKDQASKDEIIEKYEQVLKEVNSEFKHCLERNKYLEKRLDEATRDSSRKDALIVKLKDEIDLLCSERRNNSHLPDKERDQYNKEIASLSYQLSQAQDREAKYYTERENLRMTITNYEVSHKKLYEQEARTQREINQLIERLSQKEHNAQSYDTVLKDYNNLKATYQVCPNSSNFYFGF